MLWDKMAEEEKLHMRFLGLLLGTSFKDRLHNK